MSLSPRLRSVLQRDVARSTPRWSLRSLADLASDDCAGHVSDTDSSCGTTTTTRNAISRTASQTLLQCAVERLAQQHECLQLWRDDLVSNHGVQHDNAGRNIHRLLDTLQYVHADTYQLGRRLLDNEPFWERFSDPERHTANAIVLELRARHATTIEKVVDIVTELRQQEQSNDNDHGMQQRQQNQYYADTFMQRRVGIQLLCDHHVELCRKGGKRQPHGGIAAAAPLGRILTDAVLEAQHIVDVHLQIFPQTRYDADTGLRCTLVQPWIHHALVELLKNAMAATVQQMQRDDGSTIPAPVDILLSTISATLSSSSASNEKNDNDYSKSTAIAIDIVDRGTGITGGEEGLARAFELGHSSTERRWDRLHEQQSYAAVRSPLSSLGVGLPTSRYMMEHFGGQLTLRNNNSGGDDGVLGGCTARIVLPTDDTILERVPGKPVEHKYH